jgi:TolB protein
MSFMKNSISLVQLFVRCFGLLLLATLAMAAANAPAPDASAPILVIYKDANRINISVVSSSAKIALWMQNAFALHGAFQTTAAVPLQYVLHFEEAGENQVAATIEKIPGGISYKVNVTSSSLLDAAYRAGDKVVEQLTKQPGFFAGKLAFVSERPPTNSREIYVSDLLGQQVTRLTSDGKISALPRWSPDGTKLLYTGYYPKGYPDIIQLDVATQKRTILADYQGTNTGGTFSPDGKSVAMILTPNGVTELFVSDATGNNVRRLTHEATSKASPTWSPDGQRIIIADDARGHPLLYQIPAAGGALKALQTNISNYCADPAWNPVYPNKVAFMAEVGTQMFIAVYDFNEGKSTVFDTAAGSAPCWLNDGRHLLFTRRVGGMDQLFILDTAQTKSPKVVQLTHGGAFEASWVYVK